LNNAYYFFAGATSSSSSSSSSSSTGGKGKGKSKSSKHHTTPSAFHLGAKQGVKPGQIAVVTIKTPKSKKKQSTPTPNIKKTVKEHNKAIAQKKHHTPAPDIVGDARKHNQEIQAKAKASNPVHKIIHNTPPPVIPHHHTHLTKPQRDVQASAQRKQQQQSTHIPTKTPTAIHHTVAPTNPHPSTVHHVSPPPKSIRHVIHNDTPTVHTSTPTVVHPSMITPSKPASHNVIHNITNSHASPTNIQQHNQGGGVTAGIIGGTINQSPLTNVVHQQHHVHQQHLDTHGKPVSAQSLLPPVAPGSLPISPSPSSKTNTSPPRISGTDGSPKQIIKGTPNPFTNPNPNLSIGDPVKSITGVFQGIGNQLGLNNNQQKQQSSVPIHHHPLQHHITVSQTFNNPQKLAEFNAQTLSVKAAEISRHNARFKQFQTNIQKQNAQGHEDANAKQANALMKASSNSMNMGTPYLTPQEKAIAAQDQEEQDNKNLVPFNSAPAPKGGYNPPFTPPLGSDVFVRSRNADGSVTLIKRPQSQQDLHDLITGSNYAHSSSDSSYLPIVIGGSTALLLFMLSFVK
jgi:hypothetical protein